MGFHIFSDRFKLKIGATLFCALISLSTGAFADEHDRWVVCTGAPDAPQTLERVAELIAGRVARDSHRVQVRMVPLSEGSIELTLAATTELVQSLRDLLAKERVPQRRVDFQWMPELTSLVPVSDLSCTGVKVSIDVLVAEE